MNKSKTKALEINFDHIKYIVTDGQTARVTGTIDGIAVNGDSVLNPKTFLHFEHTDGGNLLHINYVQQHKLLPTKNGERNLLTWVWKAGAGINIPRTDFTWRGEALNNMFHIAGYNISAESGLRLYAFKKVFIEATGKTGFVQYINALANTPGPPPIPQIAAGLVLASGLLQVAKIVRTEPPKYAEGTLDAPETRQSITDEEGSELHFDKNWRLRDVGKESGQRMKMVYKGDKIIPADTSKIIKQIMINNAIQNKEESFKFDYDLFANKTAKAINNKSNSAFLLDNGKILKISEKNGRITIDATELNKKEYGNQRLVK